MKSCIPLGDENLKKEPLVDLEKVILKIAWDDLLAVPPSQLKWWERLCPLRKILYLEFDKSFLGVEPAKEMKLFPKRPPDGSLDCSARLMDSTTVLFQSRYRNETESAQTYSFKTERITKSSMELSLQRGFTFGQSLELDVKIPAGIPGCEVSGKLGGQMQWAFQRGKVCGV